MSKPTAVLMLAATAAAFAAGRRLVEGNPESAVRVIAYGSLACGDCAVYRAMLDARLLPRYGASVAFEHRDFPLAKQPWSRPAAVAARYVDEAAPALSVKFRRDLLEQRRQVSAMGLSEWLVSWAGKNGVDAARLTGALQDEKYAALVERDYQDGVARGVVKTPTVFVNGSPFIETFTVEEISKAIDDALAAK